ncbi:MAG: hypothetical protein IH934_03330 [Nanoarchaeota archaeon]|nr:hypothetical protein [Nanoarchaeota archaeon]
MDYISTEVAKKVSPDYLSAKSFEFKPLIKDGPDDQYLLNIQSPNLNLREYGFNLGYIAWGLESLIPSVVEGRVIDRPTPEDVMAEFHSNNRLHDEFGLIRAYVVLQGDRIYGNFCIVTDPEFSEIDEIRVSYGLRRVPSIEEEQKLEDALRTFLNFVSQKY